MSLGRGLESLIPSRAGNSSGSDNSSDEGSQIAEKEMSRRLKIIKATI